MGYKDLVVSSLKDHKVTLIDSPLGNEFILDDKWYVEMDRDGAFAMTISYISDTKTKSQKKAFIVFSVSNEGNSVQRMKGISEKIESEIKNLRNRVS